MPCYGMFCCLIQTVLVADFVVLLGTGLVIFKEFLLVKIWCTIATHMGFKIASSGCVAPVPL